MKSRPRGWRWKYTGTRTWWKRLLAISRSGSTARDACLLRRKPGGKLFVEFIALIYLSYIKKQMSGRIFSSNILFKDCLMRWNLIECYTEPGKSLNSGRGASEAKATIQGYGCATAGCGRLL
jgi:hypothetical protein